MFKSVIIKAIAKVTGIKETEIDLDIPENEKFGDYTSNIAMTMFSNFQNPNSNNQSKSKLQLSNPKNPRELAENLKAELVKDKEISRIVEKIEIAGPGFINFYLKTDVLIDVLTEIDAQKEKYGISKEKNNRLAIVEYSSPNIAKPFTIGHLRSTIIGGAVANLLEATGWRVLRDNHLGDWGTQFGKQIYAIKTWGDFSKIEKSDNPVKELVGLYVKFHEEAEKDPSLEDRARQWFKKLEEGDKEARELWQKCVDLSWLAFDKIYKLLGVKFNEEFNGGRGLGEAFFEDKMKPVIEELTKKKLLKEGKEGAKLVFFKGEKYPPAMVVKKDGTSLYHTRDLATDRYRKVTYSPDLIVNEVGLEQKLYFEQLYEMEKMLGWYKDEQRVHVGHGLIRFKEGKMSTRKGNVIWLEDVLNEAIDRAVKLGSEDKKTAEVVGIGALKWNDLKRDPKTDIIFDWGEMINMEGNSGPYLQYTYARAQSVLAKLKTQKSKVKIEPKDIKEVESLIVRYLSQFPEVIAFAAKTYSPNILCNYLYNLAQKYNTFYNSNRIIDSDNQEVRVEITKAVGQVLKNGLRLLGIEAPEKM